MDKITIAIDGPAGSGKSTISKIIAKKLNINYVDTGAMYRAITYKILKNNINFNDITKIVKLLEKTHIDFKEGHVYLDGEIVDELIRTSEINRNVSNIAKMREVREKLVQLQRNISKNKSIIMDGRDIGSFVLPNAEYKFFITASPEERGKRRYEELKLKDNTVTLENIIKEIKDRDRIDSTREISPLIKVEDAIKIDTTNKTIEESVNEVIKHIKKKGGNL